MRFILFLYKEAAMSTEKTKFAKLKRSDNVIPDYDYLFTEGGTSGKTKKGFLFKIFKLNFRAVILSCLLYVLQSSPVYVIPLVTSDIINVITAATAETGAVTAEVWRRIFIDGLIVFVFIVQNVPSTMLRAKVVSKALRRSSAGIKSAVVRKLQGLSITYRNNMQTGKIQSKFLKDIESVDQYLNCLIQGVVPNVLSALIFAFIAVYTNGIVSLFFLCVIPIKALLTTAFRKKIRASYKDLRVKTENMSSKLTTMLVMTPVTKAHGLEETEINTVEASIRQVEGSGRDVDKVNACFGAWSWVISTALNALCLIFCACLALNDIITVGDVVLYQSMFTSLSSYVTALINLAPQIGSGAEALRSISEIMNVSDVEYNIGKKKVGGIDGNVEFDGVSYHYPDNDQMVIKDFSLKVNAGECVAVVGASGSGKSTVMNMIIGFLKPSKGRLLIDGKSIEDLDLSEYRHNISVVPQNSILFPGTIRENITYGMKTYTEEELSRVVEMANVTEFLSGLPNGLDTQIGENGAKLSGGQKQRITIARALIRNPKILILDEATSALDNISEYHVQKAIDSSVKGRTTFIVAHRLSTIRGADRIVVMDEGVCVEVGTYDELMDKKGKFYELQLLSR